MTLGKVGDLHKVFSAKRDSLKKFAFLCEHIHCHSRP